jgi:DNA-binding XRE family transcriptional regulator
MILNERQYLNGKAAAEKLRAAIAEAHSAPAAPRVSPKLRKASIDGMVSQLKDLDRQLASYEELKTMKGRTNLEGQLDELGLMLTKARTARGMTQEQLATRLGLAKQQIQYYEANGYENAGLERILDVARALGVVADIRFTLAPTMELQPRSHAGRGRRKAST